MPISIVDEGNFVKDSKSVILQTNSTDNSRMRNKKTDDLKVKSSELNDLWYE